MTASKIGKIVIHKFGEYNGEINLKDCTLINCVYLESAEINKLANVLKFMFSNENSCDFEELQNADISDDTDCPFVEAHIRTSTGDICILKKSYNNGVINHEIDGNESTQLDFKNKLFENGCLFSFTCYLAPKTIESLMNLNNESRTNLIENICGNSELKMRYNQYKTKMGELEISMKLLNEHKKEFFLEKKREKVRVENSKKFKNASKELEEKFEQLMLMRLYHNERKVNETIPEELNGLIDGLNNVIIEYKNCYSESRESLKTKLDIEKNMRTSETNLSKFLNEMIAHKKKLVTYQDELASFENQKRFSEIVEQECIKYKNQVDETSKGLTRLEETHTKLTDSLAEYTELKNEFFKMNYDYFLYISTKKRIDNFQMFKDKIGKNKLLAKYLMDENTLLNDQLTVLEKSETEVQKSLQIMNARINKIKPASLLAENTIKKGTKAITDKLMDNSYGISDIKRIEKVLREKFSGIVGVLSDLFDVKESNEISVSKSQILSCLGKHSNAIVVENQAKAKEVSTYLKMQQNEQISIILIPQQYYKPATLVNLRNKSLPNTKMAPIESFLNPVSNEIKTILMHILKPTIVCDCKTFSDVQKVFNHLGKKVKVTSFAASVSCAPKNLIITHSTKVDNENIIDIAMNVTENKMKVIDLNCDLAVENHKFSLCLGRLSNIKIMIKWIKEVLVRNTNHADSLNKKTEKLEELVNILNNENYAKIVETYENLHAKFQPLLGEHYQQFCHKHKFQNIEEYEKLAPNLIHYASNRKALQETINILNGQIENLSKMQSDPNSFINEKAQLEVIIENANLEVEKAREKLEEAKIKCEADYTVWMDKIAQIVAAKEKFTAIVDRLKSNLLKICSGMNEKRMLLSENYQMIDCLLSNFETISLTEGSLLSQLTFSNDINEGFDLIQHHLNEIRPDYDALDEDLKNLNDLTNATLELQMALNSSKKVLNECAFEFGGVDNDLASINEKINNLSIEIKNTNDECQKVLGVLKTVTGDRKKRFTECLKVINGEIKKFCEITTNDRLYGKLMPGNENEPYQDLHYEWRSDNGTDFVDSSTQNWEAALAFWFGILRYKKQNFVPYFEMSSELPILDAISKYSSNTDANLQAIVFWKTGIDEEACDFTIMRYRDKMRIVDCEEQRREIERLLAD